MQSILGVLNDIKAYKDSMAARNLYLEPLLVMFLCSYLSLFEEVQSYLDIL